MRKLNIDIRPSCIEDVFTIGQNLRNMDRIEMLLEDIKSDPVIAISQSYENSLECYTATTGNDHAVGIFGIGASPLTVYYVTFTSVWFLASVDMDQMPALGMAFARRSREWVNYFYEKYGPIGNAVWESNIPSRIWLKRMGFKDIGHSWNQKTNSEFIWMVKK